MVLETLVLMSAVPHTGLVSLYRLYSQNPHHWCSLQCFK